MDGLNREPCRDMAEVLSQETLFKFCKRWIMWIYISETIIASGATIGLWKYYAYSKLMNISRMNGLEICTNI